MNPPIVSPPLWQRLDKAEIDALEADIDRRYRAAPLPAYEQNAARWRMCQFVESWTVAAINRFLKSPDDRVHGARLMKEIDAVKHGLNQALRLIDRQLAADPKYRPAPTEGDTDVAYEFYQQSMDYVNAYWIFTPIHADDCELRIDPGSSIYEIPTAGRELQYWALQDLLHVDADGFNPILDLAFALLGPDGEYDFGPGVARWGKELFDIMRGVTVRRNRLRYQLISQRALVFTGVFRNEGMFRVFDWSFPWGTADDVHAYYSALYAICFYHIVAIQFGARRLHVPELAEPHLCKLASSAQLNADIRRISHLSEDRIAAITQALTYGKGTRSPDPALQPLIPVSGDLLAIPGTVILSNNWMRNGLKLHNRIDKADFDSRSATFERQSVNRLLSSFPPHIRLEPNIHLPTLVGTEEIDLVLIDQTHRTIVLCELRWVLPPGDVTEILEKEREIRGKVAQARRKLAGCREDQVAVLKRLKCVGSDWSIEAIVLIDGFRGVPSPEPKTIPIVPDEVFVKGCKAITDLAKVHAFFASPLWLPRDGIDFDSRDYKQDLFGYRFLRHHFAIRNQSYWLSSFDRYAHAANAMTLQDLRAVEWE